MGKKFDQLPDVYKKAINKAITRCIGDIEEEDRLKAESIYIIDHLISVTEEDKQAFKKTINDESNNISYGDRVLGEVYREWSAHSLLESDLSDNDVWDFTDEFGGFIGGWEERLKYVATDVKNDSGKD